MLSENIRPSTIDGIKRLAKSIKKDRGIAHTLALDEAARLAEFENFRHARNMLLSDGEKRQVVRKSGVWSWAVRVSCGAASYCGKRAAESSPPKGAA